MGSTDSCSHSADTSWRITSFVGLGDFAPPAFDGGGAARLVAAVQPNQVGSKRLKVGQLFINFTDALRDDRCGVTARTVAGVHDGQQFCDLAQAKAASLGVFDEADPVSGGGLVEAVPSASSSSRGDQS
jgi:hypothetical protein